MTLRHSFKCRFLRRNNVDTLNLVLVLLAALVNLATAYMVLQLRKVVLDAASNISKVELATNSMKDALVEAVSRASLAEGKEQGREKAVIEITAKESKLPLVVVPVPVADDRTAKAAEQTAKATEQIAAGAERSAAADERLADAAEVKSEKPKET